MLAVGVTEKEQHHQQVSASVTPVTPVTPPRPLSGEHAAEWDADDWRAYFDERAGIAEYDGGLGRCAAESLAFKNCMSEWLDRHPEPSRPECCAWCGGTETSGSTVVPFGTEAHHHTWLHPECWAPWYQRRRERAKEALEAMGIPQTRA